jgi:hypothetical protein
MPGFHFEPLRPSLSEGPVTVGSDTVSTETIARLKRDVERLYMISEALWSILKDRYGLEEDDLVKLIGAIDMQDGRMDGRVAPSKPQRCPQCGRAMSRRHAHCIYCGAVTNAEPFAR